MERRRFTPVGVGSAPIGSSPDCRGVRPRWWRWTHPFAQLGLDDVRASPRRHGYG